MFHKYFISFGILLIACNAAANQVLFTAQISNISFFDYVNQTTTFVPGTRTLNFSFDPATLGSTYVSTNEHLAVGSGSRIDSLFSNQIPFQVPTFESFWYTVVATYGGPQTFNKSVTVKNRGTSSGSNGEVYGYQLYLTSTANESSNGNPRYFMTDPAEVLSYFTRPSPSLYFQENYYVATPNGTGGYSYPINGVWQSSNITVSVQAIPEPSTVLMLILGLMVLVSPRARALITTRRAAA